VDIEVALRVVAYAIAITALIGTAGAAHDEYDAELWLGGKLYSDQNLSLRRNQACATCHTLEPVRVPGAGLLNAPGFVDPDNVRRGKPVSRGSIPSRTGALNAPSAGYAAFSPFFHWDAAEGLFVGGQFWNGRAATLAEQAAGPFLNRVEMAMPSRWAVVTRLKEDRQYIDLFQRVYGLDLDAVPSQDLAPAELPVPPGVFEVYDRMTQAIAAFEKSRVFNRFTSKFDFVLAGRARLTPREQRGREIFSDKGKCALCHVVDPGTAPNGGIQPPLLTDFTYDNLGVPRNVNIPGNPDPDPGLAGNPKVAALGVAAQELGKHKVMSLRNIAITPPYGHNGVFRTLEEIVHFYNTRDTKPRVCIDNNDKGFGVDCWPEPEIADNVNTDELGALGLTPEEERDLVAFLKTLTDGFHYPSPFASTPFPPFP
jgi:cytochrome c peroxidase